MKRLLMPGMRLKRWVLMFFAGIALLTVFILLAFGDEFAALMSIINSQLSSLFNLPLQSYYPKLVAEIILFAVSLAFIIIGLKHIIMFLIDSLMPEKKGKIASHLSRYSLLQQAPNIVVIGGGTGLNSILTGLKEFTNNITAIVSVSDEGGSSRKLRYEFGMLPPGDIRNCIVALSDSEPLMAKLLEYRFREGEGLKGHSFGNLLLTALTKITGGFDRAIIEAGRILAIRGKVLPVTLAQTTLCAELENGKIIGQEPNVEEHKTKYKSEIKRLFLKPKNVKAFPPAIEAIKKADIIVLGPGSLYTSILPNLLVNGIREAIRSSKAAKVYVCNVMTQPGETDNYKASHHIDKIIKYLGKGVLDYAVVNSERATDELYEKYRRKGAKRVKLDEDNLKKFDVRIIKTDLITKENLLRHDPRKLAKVVVGLD